VTGSLVDFFSVSKKFYLYVKKILCYLCHGVLEFFLFLFLYSSSTYIWKHIILFSDRTEKLLPV
jgi:hypothetical protein